KRERLGRVATHLLGRGRDRLERAAGGLRVGGTRNLEAARRAQRLLAERLCRAAKAELRRVETRCDGLARVAAQLRPEHVLARGFSVTRTAAGALVRTAAEAPAGTGLVTRLAHGEVASLVVADVRPAARER